MQFSLKPKNPNLISKTQRGDQKIWAIWKPKTYASLSVKKKGSELWDSVSIYRGQKALKNRYGWLGFESGLILLRKDWKGCALSSLEGHWPKVPSCSALQKCQIGLWTPNTLSCLGAIWTPLLGFFYQPLHLDVFSSSINDFLVFVFVFVFFFFFFISFLDNLGFLRTIIL